MMLNSLKILNFRNYPAAEISSFSRTNLFIGPNGSGKTNLLEAIFTLFRLSPLRPVGLPDLIRWQESAFYIGGYADEDHVEVGFSTGKRILKINNNPAPLNEFIRSYPVVAWMPEDISIVTGTPEERRDFIDKTLSGLDGEYQFDLHRYQKALRQRNAQLKISPKDASIWDRELTLHGSRIIEKRLQFIQSLSAPVRRYYKEWYGDDIDIIYQNTFRIEHSVQESFQKALTGLRDMERVKGHTLAGPHRDNFEVRKANVSAAAFASLGQRRTIAIAMKLAAMESRMQDSILLVDDVLLEIDEQRRREILERIIPGRQIFFTATSAELFGEWVSGASVFRISSGNIKN